MKWKQNIFSKLANLIAIFTLINLNAKANPSENPILASVGKKNITVSQFVTRYSDYIFNNGIKDNIVTRRSILNNMINEILLFNYDKNDSIFNNSEYKKELKWAEKQTILAFLRDREILAKLTASDAELRDAFYRTNMKISARHLFAETEEEADALYQLLQTGADFNNLAKQVFSDTTLQNNGGYIGYFTWGDMDPAFEDAAYKLKEGEISKPVKTKFGYSIIKVDKRVPNPLLTEDEFLRKKKHVERVVKMRKVGSSEEQYIKNVFDVNKVELNEKALAFILNNLSTSNPIFNENTQEAKDLKFAAKYENKDYSVVGLVTRINNLPIFHRKKINSMQNLKAVIKGFILQDILYSIAVKKHYDKDPEVQSTIKKYDNNIFLRFKREEIADKKIFADSLIKKFYLDNPSYFLNENELNIQEIIVDKLSLADSIKNRIVKGEDFGSIASKYSLRNWSAVNNGIMGLSKVSKFGGLKDTLWNSNIGTVIGPVKIQQMYGIFKVLEKRIGAVKDFSEVKQLAERLLKKEKSKSIMQEYVEKLRKQTPIVWDDKLLGSIKIN